MADKKASRVEQELYRLKNNFSEAQLNEIAYALFDLSIDKNANLEEEAETRFITLEDLAKAKEAAKNFGLPVGLGTGFWQIDNMTAGLAPGELIVIGGATSTGKSLLAANIFANLVKAGHRAVFVTLENTADQLTQRLLQIMGEEEMNWAILNKTMKVQKRRSLSWQAIPVLVQREKKDFGAEAIFVDHLHYFVQGVDDDNGTLGLMTQTFYRTAQENQVPIIVLSHLRKLLDREQRPRMEEFKGSNYISQNADVVLSVWQERSKKEYGEHIWVGLEKNRNRAIWQAEVAQTIFDRDGLKIIPRPYTLEEDGEFNITKRFKEKIRQANFEEQFKGVEDDGQSR